MANVKRWSLLLVLLVGIVVAQGQEGGQSGGSRGVSGQDLIGVESPIISAQYVLMPGDRVLVTVSGGVTYSYESYVTYEGKVMISIPMSPTLMSTPVENGGMAQTVVEAVRVSGLTMQQAQDTLTTAMRRYFRDVNVSLTLLGLRSGIVFVTGEVQYPGAYNASSVERVSQVLAKAGGLAPLGSRANINVIRAGQLHAIADIEQFETRGDLAANPFVESGDVIYVPPVEGVVTVKGAVFGRGGYKLRTSALTTEKERVSEGIYELQPGDRVYDMIRRAGGITPWADLANCYIERLVLGGNGARKRLPVDLHAIMFRGDSSANLAMSNADVLVVPPINTLVYVEGEVQNPGPALYTPNLRASDYIGQSGGRTHYADPRRAYILRNGEKISVAKDPVVEPGDKVVMPRIGLRFWQDYLQIISAIGIPVASIIISVYALSR